MNSFTLSNTSHIITNLSTHYIEVDNRVPKRADSHSLCRHPLNKHIRSRSQYHSSPGHDPLSCASQVVKQCPIIMHCIIIDLYTTVVAAPFIIITIQIGAVHNLPESACKYQSL